MKLIKKFYNTSFYYKAIIVILLYVISFILNAFSQVSLIAIVLHSLCSIAPVYFLFLCMFLIYKDAVSKKEKCNEEN